MSKPIKQLDSFVNPVVERICGFLNRGMNDDALAILKSEGVASPTLNNLYGVALMRTGEAEKAVDLYLRLCMNESKTCLRSEVPLDFIRNYATALLLTGNVGGCEELIRSNIDRNDAYVQKLLDAIAKWRKSLGWWRRVAFRLYGTKHDEAISLGIEPGVVSAVSINKKRPAA